VIEFRLAARSNVPPYLQLVEQVRQALRMGLLEAGDQLPTVRDVAESIAINPNTVLKAYRDLERAGLVRARPGLGTFVVGNLPRTDPREQNRFRRLMDEWLRKAREAGFTPDEIEAIYRTSFRDSFAEEETA